jgi:hypothetical protein
LKLYILEFSILIFLIISIIITIIILRNNNKRPSRLRIKCVNCKYVKKRLYIPFNLGIKFASYEPTYCTLLKIHLFSESNRCELKNPSEEFYEK